MPEQDAVSKCPVMGSLSLPWCTAPDPTEIFPKKWSWDESWHGEQKAELQPLVHRALFDCCALAQECSQPRDSRGWGLPSAGQGGSLEGPWGAGAILTAWEPHFSRSYVSVCNQTQPKLSVLLSAQSPAQVGTHLYPRFQGCPSTHLL